tara:strand:+ start:548 stop:817 length:270 start_codon:yes stop_codon:yes gene_type:complete
MDEITVNNKATKWLMDNTRSKTHNSTSVDTWGGDERFDLFKALWKSRTNFVIINDVLFKLDRRIEGGCGMGSYPNSIIISREKCFKQGE